MHNILRGISVLVLLTASSPAKSNNLDCPDQQYRNDLSSSLCKSMLVIQTAIDTATARARDDGIALFREKGVINPAKTHRKEIAGYQKEVLWSLLPKTYAKIPLISDGSDERSRYLKALHTLRVLAICDEYRPAIRHMISLYRRRITRELTGSYYLAKRATDLGFKGRDLVQMLINQKRALSELEPIALAGLQAEFDNGDLAGARQASKDYQYTCSSINNQP